MDIAYTVAGFSVGAIVGLTGVGGGSLMTPLLVLLFGIHPSVAVGTDLLYAAITKSGGVLVHGKNKNIDWTITGWLTLGSVPAVLLTLWFHPGGNFVVALLGTVVLAVAGFFALRSKHDVVHRD